MKMVKLDNTLSVMPDDISEVIAVYESNKVRILMKSGQVHSVQPEYGRSLSDTYDNLIFRINEAME